MERHVCGYKCDNKGMLPCIGKLMKSKRKTFKYPEYDYECTPQDILHISKGKVWDKSILDGRIISATIS